MSLFEMPIQRPAGFRLRKMAGVTFLELLTVMSIVAVLLMIAVPSFKYVTQSNRASGEINGLLGDMQFARAEAIREGQTVTLCPSSNGTSCAGSTTWQNGWIVFSDTGNLQVVDGTDAILKIQPIFSGTDSLTSDNNIKAVTFTRDGFAMGLPNPITFTLHTSPILSQFTRCLSLTIVGGLSTQIGGATTAENTTC